MSSSPLLAIQGARLASPPPIHPETPVSRREESAFTLDDWLIGDKRDLVLLQALTEDCFRRQAWTEALPPAEINPFRRASELAGWPAKSGETDLDWWKKPAFLNTQPLARSHPFEAASEDLCWPSQPASPRSDPESAPVEDAHHPPRLPLSATKPTASASMPPLLGWIQLPIALPPTTPSLIAPSLPLEAGFTHRRATAGALPPGRH